MDPTSEVRARRLCDALGLEFRRLEPDTEKLWCAKPGQHFAAGVAAFIWQAVEQLAARAPKVSV